MNIKTLLLVTIIAISFNAKCQGEFEIKVTVNKEYVGNYLDFYGNSNTKFPIKIEDTSITISGICKDKFESCTIRIQQSDALSSIGFYIYSGKMKLKINHLYSKDTLLDIQLNGFPFQKEQEAYLAKTYSDRIKADIQYKKINALFYDKEGLEHLRDSALDELGKTRLFICNKNIIDFINKYPKSYISYNLFVNSVLRRYSIVPDSLTKIYATLNSEYKNSHQKTNIDSIINTKVALFSTNKAGAYFRNFNFKTDKDSLYNLYSLASNHYILICFWASWCGPCRRNIPRLKEIDNHYAAKGLQIISISIDDDETKWKEAIEKEKMPWLQTCDIKKYIKDIKLRDQLYVSAVPQYFLLNNKGEIVYNSIIEKDDENYSLLFKTLDKNL